MGEAEESLERWSNPESDGQGDYAA